MSDLPNIVLVHGPAWADGSSWSAVIERLQDSGYHVTAPQFPMTSLAADVARLRQVLARQDGPAIVAGHSYGGQIITALGAGAPKPPTGTGCGYSDRSLLCATATTWSCAASTRVSASGRPSGDGSSTVACASPLTQENPGGIVGVTSRTPSERL